MGAFRYGYVAAALLIAAPALAQTAQEGQMHRAEGAPAAAMQSGPEHSGMTGPAPAGGRMSDGGMMGGNMMGMRRMMGMMGMMGEDMAPGARHLEGRLAFLKTELKISDAQAPQWDAFAAAERDNAKAMNDMHRQFRPSEGAPKTLPERLTLQEKGLAAHLDAFRKTAMALENLYKVLTPDQKKIADEIVVGPMGMPVGMM
jgi:hypothetical protein